MEETLVDEDDFRNKRGKLKIFQLFDHQNKGFISKEDLFDAIDALTDLGMM